jgi:hypothetical protein
VPRWLADAAGLAHPRRGRDDQDVGADHLGADLWPGIAAAHIELHPGLDVVVNDPHGVPGDIVLGKLVEQLPGR